MRFAVLHHTGWPERPDHYDLLLQVEDGASDDDRVLKAFATTTNEFPLAPSPSPLPQGEGEKPASGQVNRDSAPSICLRLLPDHRRIYLKFEGPVARNCGQVRRVDEGEFALMSPLGAGWSEVNMQLAGTRLNGYFVLRHLGGGLYSFARRVPCIK
jgi:hypothetical protein